MTDRLTSLDARLDERVERLSPKQFEVLLRVSQLENSKQIAHAMGISPHTVDAHVRSAMEVLDVRPRTRAAQAVMASTRAIRADLVRSIAIDFAKIELAPAPEHREPHPPQPLIYQSPTIPAEPAPDEKAPSTDAAAAIFQRLPVRSRWRQFNDDSVAERIFWPIALALLTSISFLIFYAVLRGLSDLMG